MGARSVNKVVLIGNLGRDAETKHTSTQKTVTRFSVATTRGVKKGTDQWEDEVNWTNIIVWDQEKLAEYLKKGKQVYVEGRLQTRSYDDKNGQKVYATEVVAQEVILLGGRAEGQGEEAVSRPAARNGKPAPQNSEQDFAELGITDDDIPF